MAIVIDGKTKCKICTFPICNGQEIVAFPVFVSTPENPLYFFNDAAFHKKCFDMHSFATSALRLLHIMHDKLSPNARFCIICGNKVTNVDDFFALGLLTNDSDDELYIYNYSPFHKTCLRQPSEMQKLIERIANGNLTGNYNYIIDRIAEL